MLVTHLRAKVELRNQPHLADRPAVIVDRSKGRPLVVDTFPTTAGVSAGMTLEQALSHHPGTVVLEADEPSYQRVFRRMLASLQGISDRVEGAELGTAYVRLDGLESMYGGDARLVSALLHSVPEYLHPRVGLGEGKFPSFVAARVSRTQGATRVPSEVAVFLAPHSIDLLPLASQVKEKLHRFGLHTMGDVASMGPDLFTDQFGPVGMRAWNLSRGIDGSPLIPLKFEESIAEHTSLPFSSTSMELVLDGGGHSPQEGLLPPSDAGPVRGKGRPVLHPRSRTLVGEAYPLQAGRWGLGAGLPHHQGPDGVRPSPGPR